MKIRKTELVYTRKKRKRVDNEEEEEEEVPGTPDANQRKDIHEEKTQHLVSPKKNERGSAERKDPPLKPFKRRFPAEVVAIILSFLPTDQDILAASLTSKENRILALEHKRTHIVPAKFNQYPLKLWSCFFYVSQYLPHISSVTFQRASFTDEPPEQLALTRIRIAPSQDNPHNLFSLSYNRNTPPTRYPPQLSFAHLRRLEILSCTIASQSIFLLLPSSLRVLRIQRPIFIRAGGIRWPSTPSSCANSLHQLLIEDFVDLTDDHLKGFLQDGKDSDVSCLPQLHTLYLTGCSKISNEGIITLPPLLRKVNLKGTNITQRRQTEVKAAASREKKRWLAEREKDKALRDKRASK